jgi:hypothetical protein
MVFVVSLSTHKVFFILTYQVRLGGNDHSETSILASCAALRDGLKSHGCLWLEEEGFVFLIFPRTREGFLFRST